MSYMIDISYIIYFVKRCQNMIYAAEEVDVELIWVLFEVMYWLVSVFAGMIFLAVGYLARLGPFMRDEEALEGDFNPWNNKDTEDFLRHLKEEYMVMQYQMTMIAIGFIVTFSHFFDWIELDNFGPRDFWICGVLGLLCVIPRLLYFIMFSTFGLYGVNIRSDKVQVWHKIGIFQNTCFSVAILIYRFVVVGNENFMSQNIFFVTWLPLELTMKCVVEPFFVVTNIMCKKSDNEYQKDTDKADGSSINAEGGEG